MQESERFVVQLTGSLPGGGICLQAGADGAHRVLRLFGIHATAQIGKVAGVHHRQLELFAAFRRFADLPAGEIGKRILLQQSGFRIAQHCRLGVDHGRRAAQPDGKEMVPRKVRQMIAHQGQRNGRPLDALELDGNGLEPRAGRHAAQQLCDQRGVAWNDDVEKRLSDEVFRAGTQQRLRCACGKCDPVALVDLEQQIGRAKGQRDEPVTVASQRFHVA